ncbi:MAG: VWA domain-containing protein [Alcaligenaceae bacterium]|nr:VWA domain-containing protein [Alcaligenaceae bacterium]
MAEAEDVVQDVARYATIHIRRLWLRHRGAADQPRPLSLPEVRQRIDLLIHAVHGFSLPLRVAHTPARPTVLTRLFRRHDVRQSGLAIPCTDGRSIWLPMELALPAPVVAPAEPPTAEWRQYQQNAAELFRTIALQQASRALRGSATQVAQAPCIRSLALYTLLEAQAADEHLVAELPGLAPAVAQLRQWALSQRPRVDSLPPACRPIENLAQKILASPLNQPVDGLPWPPAANPQQQLETAGWLVRELQTPHTRSPRDHALFKDCWTGELLPAPPEKPQHMMEGQALPLDFEPPARSAHMPRSPKERQAEEDEDKKDPGVWMIHAGDPLEKAEDPKGTQRPTDRDEETASEEFADALSELPEARLVSSSTPAKEVLLSDDTPDRQHLARQEKVEEKTPQIHYPEWDYRINGYQYPGAIVHLLPAQHGPEIWVEKTLARHRSMLDTIRRRFEMLQADRVWLRRRLDGDEIDLDAYIEARCDLRSGLSMPQALYQQQRRQARNIAIVLLVDISGSTDSYLADGRRIIDVEREALLLVAIALQHMGEPYSIQAFSGDGPRGVTLSTLKHFNEPHSQDVALRIAALEPQYYTRTGAALRHSTTELMQQPAEHRLLLLLSDGKPNDSDIYEGRYGVEDTRRAIEEARLQGVNPFCLTIDRQAAGYLSKIFGHGHYALLSKPQELPTVLLDWMRRLMAGN